MKWILILICIFAGCATPKPLSVNSDLRYINERVLTELHKQILSFKNTYGRMPSKEADLYYPTPPPPAFVVEWKRFKIFPIQSNPGGDEIWATEAHPANPDACIVMIHKNNNEFYFNLTNLRSLVKVKDSALTQ